MRRGGVVHIELDAHQGARVGVDVAGGEGDGASDLLSRAVAVDVGPDPGDEARATLTTRLGPAMGQVRGEGHECFREWPPVARDVRDPDADRRHSATSWTQVRLGRPLRSRRPRSGARLPKVGMSGSSRLPLQRGGVAVQPPSPSPTGAAAWLIMAALVTSGHRETDAEAGT